MFSLLTVGFTYAGDIGGMFVCAPFSLLSLGMLIVKIFFPDRMRHDHYIHDERGVK